MLANSSDELPGVLRRCRAPLKLVETAPLLLSTFGQETGHEDLAVRRVWPGPAEAYDLDAGFCQVKFVGGTGALRRPWA